MYVSDQEESSILLFRTVTVATDLIYKMHNPCSSWANPVKNKAPFPTFKSWKTLKDHVVSIELSFTGTPQVLIKAWAWRAQGKRHSGDPTQSI